MEIAGDRRSSEAHRGNDQTRSDGESEHRAVSVRFGSNHGDDDEYGAHESARNANGPARCSLGDDPPGSGDHQSDCDQPNHEKSHIPQGKDEDSDREEHGTPERRQGKRALAPADRASTLFHASS